MMPNRTRARCAQIGGMVLALTLACGAPVQAQDFLTNTLDKLFKPQAQDAQPVAPEAPPAGWQDEPAGSLPPAGAAGGMASPVPGMAEQAAPGAAPGAAPLPPRKPGTGPATAGTGGSVSGGGMATGNPEMGAPPATQQAARGGIQPAVDGRATAATIQRITDYYNSVQSMSGTFTQTDPDGSRRTGDFYMQKPGRVRFQYDDPSPVELIANGQSVAVRDRRLNTQDITPLGQTPLRFLLAQQVDLARDKHVTDIFQDERFVTVVMQQQVPMMGTYRLLLLFDVKSGALKQWIITDPQGYDTQVVLNTAKPNSNPDPRLFVINFERMLQ